MELIPLISIPAIFLFIAFTKPHLQPKIKFNLCAICIAVASTWLVLAGIWLFGGKVSPDAIGILMGMSIAGVMYKAENFYKNKKIKNFWFVRLSIIVGGFYTINSFLSKSWNTLLLTMTVTIISISIASLFFQGDKENDHSKGYKRLDNCC